MQWHPDTCQEPDAKEQFMRIQHAYEVLTDHNTRSKYDVGLRLAASVGKAVKSGWSHNIWRSPLRCGLLLVVGTLSLGRLNVQRILKWDDITNAQSQTMTSFWPRGGKEFQTRWV
jgi:curved DNA-binding protein CbpA